MPRIKIPHEAPKTMDTPHAAEDEHASCWCAAIESTPSTGARPGEGLASPRGNQRSAADGTHIATFPVEESRRVHRRLG